MHCQITQMVPESDKGGYCEEDVEVKEGFVESVAKGRDGLDCDQKECEKGLFVKLIFGVYLRQKRGKKHTTSP